MSQMNGQLTTCERCGAQVFRKCTGEGETDGGYTHWNKFEPYPEGWGLVEVPEGAASSKHVRVCPACHKVWNRVMMEYFIAGTRLDIAKEESK